MILSVIVPNYKAGDYLLECVESIQSFCASIEFEIIVVDDCSDTESDRRALDAVSGMTSVKVLLLDKNSGAQVARNTGLSVASGDYVMTVDSDDVLTGFDGLNPDEFWRQVQEKLEGNDQICFVHSTTRMFGMFNGDTRSAYPLNVLQLLHKHHVQNSIIYRRREIELGLRYDESILKWQDWGFGVELCARRWARGEGLEVGFIDGPFYGYRIHATHTRISTLPVSELEMCEITVRKHLPFFNEILGMDLKCSKRMAEHVVAAKPTLLQDFLLIANNDHERATRFSKDRELKLLSNLTEQLGIP
ncbi:glycosyltransferase [Tateyamaria omphalii]|uniref:glycosyltransferase family 2 protein n=1 Tax=Tateyamaria omphalii TaxID=299262 RepID=UPI001C9A035C|nr:glycosyltransferase family A protein [Tateyamaria omphalii]MBY5935061.1 glycosyltransferase [Tateyamaria omphalii]